MTTEEILQSILSKAAENQKTGSNAADTSNDPVFHILAAAVANQLAILHQEQKISQAGILEQLATRLLNRYNYGLFPAHGIMHATPVNAQTTIQPALQFTAANDQYYLTPCITSPLINANLAYFVTSNKVYHSNHPDNKLLLQGICFKDADPALFLGLEPDKHNTTSLDGLNLFFTHPQQETEQQLLHHLPYVKCYIDGHQHNISPWPAADHCSSESTITQHTVREQIADKWSKNFLTLHTSQLFSPGINGLPETLISLLRQHLLKPENYIWIKLEFPGIPNILLEEAQCHINAFPVANLRPVAQTIKLSELVNIHTLDCTDYLSEITSVKDQLNDTYHLSLFKSVSELVPGECIILPESMHSFDQRTIQTQLQYFAEQITNELHIHKAANDHLTIRTVSELERVLQHLNNTLPIAAETPTSPILYIHRKAFSRFLSVNMLTTQGNQVNINYNSKVFGPESFTAKEFKLLTHISGAGSIPSPNEKLQDLRLQLISKNYIVTKNDIRLLCAKIIGKYLVQTSVKKKSGIGSNNQYTRIILINIQLLKVAETLHPQQLTYFRQEILYALKYKSWITHPVHIHFSFAAH
ncbi:hypothetical protein [Chitinophaga sp. Cy-1792]|uniref:hypothetical protein n=1 Tax=Chitinophaga sp. Cy-1792 TaxID=2608339 RepID=UPI00141E5CC8|nr:hypothetical protein [Chitinophaga sp. Cy-1792]NIG53728.1 hypothetical protein [Chitinophaga sp. Cy-1792]